jgi:hypothetical protein
MSGTVGGVSVDHCPGILRVSKSRKCITYEIECDRNQNDLSPAK